MRTKRSRKPFTNLNPFIVVSIRYQRLFAFKFLPTIRTTHTQLQFPVVSSDMSCKCCHYDPYHPRSEILLGRTNKRAAAKGHKGVTSLVANLAPPRGPEDQGVVAPNGRNAMSSLNVGSHNLRSPFSGQMEFAMDTFGWRIEAECLVDDVSCGWDIWIRPTFLKACLGRISEKVDKDLCPFHPCILAKYYLDETKQSDAPHAFICRENEVQRILTSV